MHRKGFYSIQFLLSIAVFIFVLFGAIIVLLLKTEFFFNALNEKNQYINAMFYSNRFNDILYVKPSLILNITTYNLIKSCSLISADPTKGIHDNPAYDTLKSYIGLEHSSFLTIYVTKYLLLTADYKLNALERQGTFNNTYSFKIWREDLHDLYKNLTINNQDYTLGEVIDLNGENYELDYINGRTGLFAILKKEEMKCGINPKAHIAKSFVFYRYAPYYNALYEFKVVLW